MRGKYLAGKIVCNGLKYLCYSGKAPCNRSPGWWVWSKAALSVLKWGLRSLSPFWLNWFLTLRLKAGPLVLESAFPVFGFKDRRVKVWVSGHSYLVLSCACFP